jgi:Ca-activated chloride channel family protein
MTSPSDPDAASRLVATDARTLPLTHTSLAADAGGGLARVVLEQRFRNPYDEPLVVTYSLPLPHDAAVGGFAFRVGDRRIVGEIDRRTAARERFEEALATGHTAALLEEERSTVFTQHIGNVPPGAEVVAEITLDQKLAWTDEGGWEWRFPTTVAPRYLGAPGRVADADRVAQDVSDGPMPVRMTFALTIRDAIDARLPHSPSHALRGSGTRIEQADREGVPLDRDVVVRWCVGQNEPGVRIETVRGPKDRMFALLTLVPPMRAATKHRIARDLVLLLDVSGSMSGEPLSQAKRVVSALVGTLDACDTLEMISFASSAERWKHSANPVTPAAKREALAWIAALRASGATEMRGAIETALRPLRDDAQRQVVVVTDGLIGFESEVVAAVLDGLPLGSRVHVVGVGSAPNRTLTAGAPRAGHGVEVLVGIGEDAERAAARIVAATDAPVVVDLELAGDALVSDLEVRMPDLFAGSPVLVPLQVREGALWVRGRTHDGTWKARVTVPPADERGRRAVAALYARDLVEELEMQIAAGRDLASLEENIERVGLDFGIATRATSWVAVSEERTVDPQAPLRRVKMPHELPYGTSVEGLGLRPPGAVRGAFTGLARVVMVGAAPGEKERGIAANKTVRRRAPAAPSPAPGAPPAFGGPAPTPRAAPRSSRTEIAGRRRLSGTITSRTDRVATIEIVLPEAMAWAPPERVAVQWSDGTWTDVAVVSELSTRSGQASAGASVRLALDVTAEGGIVFLTFEHAGEPWVVGPCRLQ